MSLQTFFQGNTMEWIKATKPRVVILIALTGIVSLFISAKGNVTILQLLIAGISGYLTIGGSHLVNAYIDRQT
ncbi:MAG: hypothetical protein ACXAC7_04395, partial [Candidatus Hodarchaeales archaeon]